MELFGPNLLKKNIILSMHKGLSIISNLFDRDGKKIMWGRSISYRYAAVTVFPLMGYENDTKLNYGWMGHIASNTM